MGVEHVRVELPEDYTTPTLCSTNSNNSNNSNSNKKATPKVPKKRKQADDAAGEDEQEDGQHRGPVPVRWVSEKELHSSAISSSVKKCFDLVRKPKVVKKQASTGTPGSPWAKAAVPGKGQMLMSAFLKK